MDYGFDLNQKLNCLSLRLGVLALKKDFDFLRVLVPWWQLDFAFTPAAHPAIAGKSPGKPVYPSPAEPI